MIKLAGSEDSVLTVKSEHEGFPHFEVMLEESAIDFVRANYDQEIYEE